MLVQLYIENVAVIQKAVISLSPGFHVFTGETGAGKTILISAIDAVLGERTSREIIRAGEEKAVVSALFESLSPQVVEKLAQLGYSDDEGALLISREINQNGKSSCKINGMPATTSILREVASLLIHIHGQRDSNQLLLSERHIDLIDMFGNLDEDVAAYQVIYHQMRELQEELDSLNTDDAQKHQRIDMLTFQVEEIEAASLEDPDEEDSLMAKRAVIRNSEKIVSGLSQAYGALTGGEDTEGINDQFDSLLSGILSVSQYVGQFEEMATRLQEVSYELTDCAAEIRTYLDDFEFDPREQSDIESRLDTIYKLKRKYGTDIGEILAYYQKAKSELDAVTNLDQRREELSGKLSEISAKARKASSKLSAKRRKAAKSFMAQVESELAFLDMPSVKLSLADNEKELSSNGADSLEFLIVTNVGETPKPLSKIASGGEIARIMLAIKNVLADRDSIDTLIFDEVDTGVSGRAAQKIGQKLHQVSRDRQVIAVTHLAQVAAFADTHYYIHKDVQDGRTFTHVTKLDHQQVLEELARITSGDLINDVALQNAQQLWENSHKN